MEKQINDLEIKDKRKILLGPRDRPKSIIQWIALSLQHVFAMFGANVLVPIIINKLASSEVINMSMALFASGIGTIVYIILTSARVPIYLGSSFAFMTVIGTGYSNWGNSVFLAVFVVGLLYVIVGTIIYYTSNKWLVKLFSPIVVGPIIMIIGLGAIPNGLEDSGFIWDKTNVDYPQWLSILIAFIVIMIAAILMLKAKGFMKIIPILGALVFGYILCAIIQLCDQNIKLMDLSKITNVGEWEWYPNFKNVFSVKTNTIAPAMVAIVPIAFVTMVEHYGHHSNLSSITGENFIEKPGIGRTLLADGVSISLAGLIGAPANTTYAENTSVVGITKIASVWVTGLAAVFAIMLSFLAPVNQLIAMIPKPVLGGISVLLFGIIAINGVRIMIEEKVDLMNAKNIIIGSLTLGIGIGLTISEHFNQTFIQIGDFQLSGLLLATITGVVLNVLLPNQSNDGIFKFKKNKE